MLDLKSSVVGIGFDQNWLEVVGLLVWKYLPKLGAFTQLVSLPPLTARCDT
jgi:hypothetical protein